MSGLNRIKYDRLDKCSEVERYFCTFDSTISFDIKVNLIPTNFTHVEIKLIIKSINLVVQILQQLK